MSYIHYKYVKVYYSQCPHIWHSNYSISLFLQLIWESKFEAMPTHSGDQMVSDQAITWSGIGGLSAIRGGMAPLRLYPNPSFLLKLLAFCKREGEGGGAEKRLLASLLLGLPVRLIYRGVIWVLLCTCCSFYYSLRSKKLLEYKMVTDVRRIQCSVVSV